MEPGGPSAGSEFQKWDTTMEFNISISIVWPEDQMFGRIWGVILSNRKHCLLQKPFCFPRMNLLHEGRRKIWSVAVMRDTLFPLPYQPFKMVVVVAASRGSPGQEGESRKTHVADPYPTCLQPPVSGMPTWGHVDSRPYASGIAGFHRSP